MAKTKTKIKGLDFPKSKTSLYLCCFGSLHKTSTDSSFTPSQHNRSRSWFPWHRIRPRMKKLMTKTVPFVCADETEKLELKSKGRANKVHSSWWKSKSHIQFQLSWVKNLFFGFQQNRGNNKIDYDMHQRRGASLTRATSTLSHVSKHSQTTLKYDKHKQLQNAKRCNPMVATLVVMIPLVSLIWGRLCAILCTFTGLFLIPGLRMTFENNQ